VVRQGGGGNSGNSGSQSTRTANLRAVAPFRLTGRLHRQLLHYPPQASLRHAAIPFHEWVAAGMLSVVASLPAAGCAPGRPAASKPTAAGPWSLV
jgi:hypothetical protein